MLVQNKIKLLNQELAIKYIPKGFYHYILHKGSVSMPTKKSVYSKFAVLNEIEKIVDSDSVDNFKAFKKNILVTAFLAKEFQLLKTLYKDLHFSVLSSAYFITCLLKFFCLFFFI